MRSSMFNTMFNRVVYVEHDENGRAESRDQASLSNTTALLIHYRSQASAGIESRQLPRSRSPSCSRTVDAPIGYVPNAIF